MIDYSNSNEFLSHTYDLFEATYLSVPENFKTEQEKHHIFFTRTITKNIKKEEMYNKALLYEEVIKGTIPSFQELFDFGTYIKCMEKVFFIENDINCPVCCDATLSDRRKRKLIINFDKVTIALQLEITDSRDEFIDIVVTRSYGKKMMNQFKIKNREVVYETTDDLMLMNSINSILKITIYNFYHNIINRIYNEEIFPIDYTSDFIKE